MTGTKRTLRGRLVVASAGSILVAVALFAVATVLLVGDQLRGSLDTALRQRAQEVAQLAVSAPAVLTDPGALESPVSGRDIVVEGGALLVASDTTDISHTVDHLGFILGLIGATVALLAALVAGALTRRGLQPALDELVAASVAEHARAATRLRVRTLDPVVVRGDEDGLRRVLDNLIDNLIDNALVHGAGLNSRESPAR